MGDKDKRKPNDEGFTVFNNKGFQIKLENGIIASVMFDSFNLCNNRGIEHIYKQHGKDFISCKNAEVAFFSVGKDGKRIWETKRVGWLVDKELEDDVIGWTTVETFITLLDKARNL